MYTGGGEYYSMDIDQLNAGNFTWGIVTEYRDQ